MKNGFLVLLVFIVLGCTTQSLRKPELSNAEVGNVTREMMDLMIHDITNPPLAARFFSYACLAGYEVVAENNHRFRSMHDYVNGYPELKKPDSIKGYSYTLASILSMLYVAEKIQPSGPTLKRYENAFLDSCRAKGFTDETIGQSQKYASVVSKEILAYAKSDRYNRMSNLPRYTPLQQPGKWYPTPPGYLPAVEPYFTTVRPFLIDSASQFRIPPPVPFSTEKKSAFYRLMYANYTQAPDSLSDEHRTIALYWDCNPFAIQDEGHLMVGLKKISPGAHWVGITDIACRQTNQSFDETLFIHTLVSMGLMDSFMACWDEKYRSNRIRPETAIRQLIDVRWKPLLQTPPFPEYTSGHACISATSAAILSHYIGKNVSFVDTVEMRYGLPSRRFSSFDAAAKEAAISRFYGGIHFTDATDNGAIQGRKVGDFIVEKMTKR